MHFRFSSRDFITRAESVHYFDESTQDYVVQTGNFFRYALAGQTGGFNVPVKTSLKPFSISRLARRLSRLDHGTCLPVPGKNLLFIFFQKSSYLYDISTLELKKTNDYQFRNPLHGGVALTTEGSVYFGEYFFNREGREVKVFCSSDYGLNWEVSHVFPAGSIWHVHGVKQDPFCPGQLWLFTGDYDGQCRLLMTDDNFRTVNECGGTNQYWRAASLMFCEDRLVWGMDSPDQQPRVVSFDRKTSRIELGQNLPGPVWFSKNLNDGTAVLQTSVEWYGKKIGTTSKDAKVFFSTDLDNWQEIASFKKDFWHPGLFRHGVISFSEGNQSSKQFTIHGDALNGLDGKIQLISRLKN